METYSYSRLSSFGQCPYAWSRNYIDGDRGRGSCFSEYGSLIHSIMERVEKKELPMDCMVDTFEWEFDDAIQEDWMKTKNGTLRDSYYKQGVDFLSAYRFEDVAEVLGVEEHFVTPIDDWQLQGFIDLVYRDNDGKLCIRDYKSGKNWSKAQIAEHARQPYLYSKYIFEKYGVFPDYLEFYAFRENKSIKFEFNEDDYNSAIQWANEQVNMLREAWDYPKNPDRFFCLNLCGYRGECSCSNYWYWNKDKE